MAWNDDSWKDGYDEWKLRSPYDEWDEEPECDHDEYEADILTGRAFCCKCDHTWDQTPEEINREIELQAAYDKAMDRENRRQWWRDRIYPVRMFMFRVLERIWPRKALSVLEDDEIPF